MGNTVHSFHNYIYVHVVYEQFNFLSIMFDIASHHKLSIYFYFYISLSKVQNRRQQREPYKTGGGPAPRMWSLRAYYKFRYSTLYHPWDFSSGKSVLKLPALDLSKPNKLLRCLDQQASQNSSYKKLRSWVEETGLQFQLLAHAAVSSANQMTFQI